MSNRWMAALPGLLMAGALVARNQGMFGGNQQALAAGLSPKDLEGNNDVWRRLGQGNLPNGDANPMMQPQAGAPMQLPGGDMAAKQAQLEQQQASRRAIANTLPQPQMPMQNPAQPYAMPNGLAGPVAQPPLAIGNALPTMAQPHSFPSSMQAWMQQPNLPIFASMPQRGLI